MIHKYSTDELVSQKPSEKVFLNEKRNPISFVLHNIRSLENVGLFFRLADAIRAEKIYLTGYTGYPRLPTDRREERIIIHAEKEINKTAIKLVPFVPWEYSSDPTTCFTSLKSRNYELTSVEQTDQSVDYRKANYKFPVALIFGHERTGVEDDLLEKSDLIVHVPMEGMGNSHNVAMCGAIIGNYLLNLL